MAVAALILLGLIGGSMIVADAGFTTSSKRATSSIFVSGTPAYLVAAIMFSMSVLGMLALMRERRLSRLSVAIATLAYASIAAVLIAVMQ